VPYLWGPVQGMLFAAGDVNRPGHVYHSLPDEPDHWPATGLVDVCAASEQIMNGLVYGGQSFAFSLRRLYALYPNLSGAGAVTSTPTSCTRGLAAPWWFAVGMGGIYFGASDGIYRTTGGAEEYLSHDIEGLFQGRTVNGYLPINLGAWSAMRMTLCGTELWVGYEDTSGVRRVLILDLLDRDWRWYSFAAQTEGIFEETDGGTLTVLLGGRTSGKLYQHLGTSDDGVAITANVRTACLDQGDPRAEKQYGDVWLDVEQRLVPMTIQAHLNNERQPQGAIVNPPLAGRNRVILGAFGTTPIPGRNVAIDVTWAATGTQPSVYMLGVSFVGLPANTIARATAWSDLGRPEAKYLTGIALDCTTLGLAKTILVEYTRGSGAVQVAATLAVTANGRRIQHFSWAPVIADLVRLRPTDANEWQLYDAAWAADAEPPGQPNWNQNYTVAGSLTDKWIKGVLLEVDTFGATKTIQVQIDQVTRETFTLTTSGRTVVHQTFVDQYRGRVLRLLPTDSNPSHLYQPPQWIFDEEPFALSRWETQEITHGVAGWHIPLEIRVAYRAPAPVSLTLTAMGEDGTTLTTQTIVLPSTANVKAIKRVGFTAARGVLFKYLFTAAASFWLYREESSVTIQPWHGGGPETVRPFGNDNLDATRGLTSASAAAAKTGGGTA
jgi:hypothetical protein